MITDNLLHDDPLWYKDGVIYQVHVKAFKDSTSDGIGDFGGLLQKLDYIKSLGVTAIWLLPFYPSPLRDDGYDISDYYNINSDYGTLEDFKKFLKEAHRLNIKVIIELVLNHTSDQHVWFKRARESKPDSPQRDFYVWSDTPEKYKEARIIFSDFETSNWAWDPVAKAYYWHRFYSHQPDLNFDNPQVHKALIKAIDYWFEIGVDGLRLDAVPYLYEREGTNCENLPETHAFLKKISSHVKEKFNNKMLLAEANQWPEDAVSYFGEGDECQMAFNFPLMPRIYMATQMENRFPIIDILEQTPPIPENCQWAMFLRNHDELTLEMVTDEERDYMYRYFAKESRAKINLGIRRRLAPLIENNRRKIELMNILLFSFPGTPIIYYGDEIGMGDNFYLGDRNGVRTPMQWSSDRNAGFSDANPQKLYLPIIIDPEYHYEAINVEVQQRNPSSLLWWMKRAITIRKNSKAFGRGSFEFLSPGNPKVIAFIRKYNEENILVVANLSRFSQVVELNLSDFNGYVPIEAFSRNKFPVIRENQYMLTLNAYDYYWFKLEKKHEIIRTNAPEIPEFSYPRNWKKDILEDQISIFEGSILPRYISLSGIIDSEWAKVQNCHIIDEFILSDDDLVLLVVRIDYMDSLPEYFIISVGCISGEEAKRFFIDHPNEILLKYKNGSDEKLLVNAVFDPELRGSFIKIISRKSLKGKKGSISSFLEKRAKRFLSNYKFLENSKIVKANRNSYNLIFADTFFFKLYNRLEEGQQPGAEILKFLEEETHFRNVPDYSGIINYEVQGKTTINLGLLTENISQEGTAYKFFMEGAGQFMDKVISRPKEDVNDPQFLTSAFSEVTKIDRSKFLCETIDPLFSDMVKLLSRRTGELHRALASSKNNPSFTPEPFTSLYQRSLYQSLRTLTKETFRILSSNKEFIESKTNYTEILFPLDEKILSFASKLLTYKISAFKIRIHGDYHLGQVLYTGRDFVITNLEGIASLSLSERRLKRSPLRDVASILWSFLYTAYSSLFKYQTTRPEEISYFLPFARQWWYCMGSIFIHIYNQTVDDAGFLPEDRSTFEFMMKIYMLDKLLLEVKNAVSGRSEGVIIPILGLINVSEELN